MVTAIGGIGREVIKSIRINFPNIHIIGVDANVRLTNNEFVDEHVCVPYSNSELYDDCIMNVIEQKNVKLIFPCSFGEMRFFLSRYDELKDKGVVVVADSMSLFELCNDKYELFEFLLRKGVRLPQYLLGSKKESFKSIDYYPVVIKPRCDSYASNNVMVALNYRELLQITSLFDIRGIEYIIQEWKGDSTEEYTVSVTCDPSGNVLGAVAMQRLFESGYMIKSQIKIDEKHYLVSSGISSGRIINNRYLLNQAIEIAVTLGCKGPINLQGIWDNNVFWLIDAHSAITASVYSKALAGYNDPEYYIKQYLLHIPYVFDPKEIVIQKSISTKIVNENKYN